MAIRDELRAQIGDTNSANYAYTDTILDTIIQSALNEVNSYDKTSYTVLDLDPQTPATVAVAPGYTHVLVLLRSAISVLQSLMSKASTYVKMQTQDSVRDPGDAGSGIAKALKFLTDDYMAKVKYWIGLDISSTILGVNIEMDRDVGNAELFS